MMSDFVIFFFFLSLVLSGRQKKQFIEFLITGSTLP